MATSTEPDGLRRRHLLAGGLGAAAAVGVLGPATISSPVTASRHRHFQHGVASGDPLPEAVLLWTRVTPTPDAAPGSGRGDAVRVVWEVALDDGFRRVVRRGTVRTDARRDHTVKLDVDGLSPSTTYWYRFRVGPHDSPVGRTRTAPAPDEEPDRLRLGVVCCANWQAGHFAAYRHLVAQDLDLVVHLGDYLYEYEVGTYSHGPRWDDVRHHDPTHETVTLEDYRRRHAQYKTDPDLRALHAAVPFVVTWDDHEVVDGWWPGGAFEHDPAADGSWDARRRAALRAYDEWMPVRLSGTAEPGDGTRIHRRLRLGRLVELTMLDLRSGRDERVEPGDDAVDADDRALAGADQHAWLVEGLATSTARWKLVGNPVMVAPVLMPPRPRGEELALRGTTDPTSWGPAEPNTDQWDGYPAERRALLGALAEQDVPDVLFLSGDVHTSWANDVVLDGRVVASELVCPSVTSNNVDDFMGTEPRTVSLRMEDAIQRLNPHVDLCNLDDHGFCVVEVTAAQARLEWHAIGDRRDPGTPSRLLAARRVVSGVPGLRPA